MTFHLLNINEEPNSSLLLGYLKDREGLPVIVLYELQEGSLQNLGAYLDDLLASVARVFNMPDTVGVMVYHRQRYHGAWYKYNSVLEVQDAQSLDFMGFDPDIVRSAARDTSSLGTIHIHVDGFAKETSKLVLFETLDTLWEQAVGVDDFKARLITWAQPRINKVEK